MKLLSTLLLGFTLSLLVSCGGASIEKKWKLDDMNVEALLKEVPAENLADMKKGVAENLASTKGKIILDFQKGGKFITESPSFDGTTNKETGKWKLSEDKKMINAEVNGQNQEFVVHELTSNKLTIEPKGQKLKLIFVPMK